jgi:predicted RNase H-like nuclease (RuvC/YqgF family)
MEYLKESVLGKLHSMKKETKEMKTKCVSVQQSSRKFKKMMSQSLLEKLELVKFQMESKVEEGVQLQRLETKKLSLKIQRLQSQLKIAQSGQNLEIESMGDQISEMETALIDKQKQIKNLEEQLARRGKESEPDNV